MVLLELIDSLFFVSPLHTIRCNQIHNHDMPIRIKRDYQAIPT